MQNTLFLHIGMPKCATTTVQAYLANHAPRLRHEAIHYDLHPDDQTKNQGNAAHLAADILNGRLESAEALLEHFLDRDGTVVLSSEMLIAAGRTAETGRVLERVRQLGFVPQVVCYLRRQDFWIESDFKQHVKGHSAWVGSIHELVERRAERRTLDYCWMLENWANLVGSENVHVIPLNPSQSRSYAVERFLTLLGAASEPDDGRRDSNVSPPTGLIEPARYIKREALRKGHSIEDVAAQVQDFIRTAPSLIDVPARKFVLPQRTRLDMVEEYAASNEALERRFLSGKKAFDDAVPGGADEPPVEEEVSDILAAYALRPQKITMRGGLTERLSQPLRAFRRLRQRQA
ncbi:hypothetical protein ACFSUD_09070 [Sulfitobacter aestuarii]|uniref:Sulfotransferase family protein n=1 Tax=Sulfitobacter aestuarii TaxID=2161676 RepID=A0ABW5U480_9RHOB